MTCPRFIAGRQRRAHRARMFVQAALTQPEV
jgi:hypothetical protein